MRKETKHSFNITQADGLKSRGKKIEVSIASDFVYNYLNGLRNENKSFGIVIAGYDETKVIKILPFRFLPHTHLANSTSLNTTVLYDNKSLSSDNLC